MSKSQYVDWEFECQNSNLPVSWCRSNLWLDLLVASPWINKGEAAKNLQLWSPSATWKDCVLLLFPFFLMCDFCLPRYTEFRQRMVTARVQKCLTDPIHPPNALMNQIIHAFRILFLLCNVLCCCWCKQYDGFRPPNRWKRSSFSLGSVSLFCPLLHHPFVLTQVW